MSEDKKKIGRQRAKSDITYHSVCLRSPDEKERLKKVVMLLLSAPTIKRSDSCGKRNLNIFRKLTEEILKEVEEKGITEEELLQEIEKAERRYGKKEAKNK